MSESMVERVAAARLEKAPAGYGMTRDEAMTYARFVIKAMREPTLDAMIDAALNEVTE